MGAVPLLKTLLPDSHPTPRTRSYSDLQDRYTASTEVLTLHCQTNSAKGEAKLHSVFRVYNCSTQPRHPTTQENAGYAGVSEAGE